MLHDTKLHEQYNCNTTYHAFIHEFFVNNEI